MAWELRDVDTRECPKGTGILKVSDDMGDRFYPVNLTDGEVSFIAENHNWPVNATTLRLTWPNFRLAFRKRQDCLVFLLGWAWHL